MNGTVYVSGQLSIDPATGKITPGGIKEQACQVLSNLALVLGGTGLKKEHVAFCRVCLPDVKDWPELNEVYAEFFWRSQAGPYRCADE